MIGSQWSLVVFTLLVQTSVGVYVASVLFGRKLAKGLDEKQAGRLVLPGYGLAAVLVAVGLLVSLFHLGDPLNAPKAILNIATSWLSREIAATGAYAFLALLSLVLLAKSRRLSGELALLTSLVGVAAIFMMTKVYSTALVPAWQGNYTLISFYASGFLLGPLLALACVAMLRSEHLAGQMRALLVPTFLVAACAMAVQIVVAPAYMGSLAELGSAGRMSAALLNGDFGWAVTARWALLATGLLVMSATAVKRGQTRAEAGDMEPSGGLLLLAVAAVMAGEVLGRYLFYAGGVQLMVGG